MGKENANVEDRMSKTMGARNTPVSGAKKLVDASACYPHAANDALIKGGAARPDLVTR